MITSTMMDQPLTVTQLLRHGARVHAHRRLVTWDGERSRVTTFAETNERIERLAAGLESLGVRPGDVVGTFMWNRQEHVEAYFAVPCMGAVLHQLNIRLFPDQLVFVVEDLGDKVVIIDDSLIPLMAGVVDRLPVVETFVVVGDGDATELEAAGKRVVRYDALLESAPSGYAWPVLDENTAAASCYTTGTTGNPKGVVYSHRSVWAHTMGAAAAGLRVEDGDRLLLVVPQFHANAWGLVHISWAFGADLLLPAQYLQPEPLTAFVEDAKPTCAAGVPTVWNALLALGESRPLDLSTLRWVVAGGSAVPRKMIADFKERYGINVVQAWGMTEISPLGAIALPPAGVTGEEELGYRCQQGRIVPGVEFRLMDFEGKEQPWDGKSIGEVQVRGPWVAGRYHGAGPDPEKFQDGWLRTGDVGTLDALGFLRLVDRTKDVIKSGGEWVSSVDLENTIMAHPDVLECAVIAVPDERWDERPLACVVPRPGRSPQPAQINEFLREHVAAWWLPERYAFIEEVPKTSVGKFDKKVLRALHEEGRLPVLLLQK